MMVPFQGQNVAAIRVRAVEAAVVAVEPGGALAGAGDPNDALGL